MNPKPEKENADLLAVHGRSIFTSVFDIFGFLDLEGRVVEMSGRIFDSTAVNPRFLHGQRFYETVFWQSSEVTPTLLEQAIRDAAAGVPNKLILDFRVNADEKSPLEVRIVKVKNEDKLFILGQIVNGGLGLLGESETLADQMLLAAENASIGLWYWDLAQDQLFATPTCNELFGLASYGSFAYEDYLKAVHPDDRDFVRAFIEASRLGGTRYSEEFRVLYPNGTIEWIWANGRCFLDDERVPVRMMGVVRKVTEQKVAAEELVRVHELERRARDEAVEANKAKDFFISFISHELRSPLNAIQGWATILLTKDLDEEKRRSALETIQRSSRLQAKILNDLVDSSRVASGRIRLQYVPTDLVSVVRNSFEDQRPGAEAKRLGYEMISDVESVPFLGDANRLQQVFSNLLSNAIKFSHEGGSVSVSIQTTPEVVEISVTDAGRGIDASVLPVIFNQFAQGDVYRTKTDVGLGLGLSLVKVLVSKHRGSVRAESDGPDKGSKFTVVFPLTDGVRLDENPRDRSVSDPEKRLAGVKVFIVEDDPDSREVLELFLSQNGADVRSFESARAALETIGLERRSLPSVIISDIGMPDEDGYSLIAKMRGLPAEEGGSIPAIALSAFTSEESRQRAMECGFDRYSTKPFEQEILINDILDLVHGQLRAD